MEFSITFSHPLSDEYTLRWDDSFYAAGFFIALSGVLAWVISILEDRDKKRERESQQFTEAAHAAAMSK